jgi:hypothetical protein
MTLSVPARVVMVLASLLLLCLIPASLIGLPTVGLLYYVRHTDCSADTFLAIKPFWGDFTYDALLIIAIDVLLCSMVATKLIDGVEVSRTVKKFTRVPRILALGVVVALLCAFNRTQQTCIKAAGIEYRPTFGRSALYPWHSVTNATVDCIFGSGKNNRLDFRIEMLDGTRIKISQDWDIVSNPANQVNFWQNIYANHIPVKIGAFHTYDPGCWRLFPGLRNTADLPSTRFEQ